MMIMAKKYIRKKPSIKIRKSKNGLEIVRTLYDEFGNVLKHQVESITK